MDSWIKKVTPACALLGGLCLAGTAVECIFLDRGGALECMGTAAALLLLAGLAVLLLRFEGVDRDRLLVMLLPIGAAMLARVFCLDYASGDYNSFLTHWYEFFRSNGGFRAIAQSVGDYNVPYLYFMAAISYFSLPDLYLIKLFSILFDVILAWGGLRLACVLRGGREGDAVPLIAFSLLLFLPTVVLNGAYWGQCDAIYGALVVHAVASVLEGRNKSSVALMAVAFSFKLQTVFVLPLWGVLWLAKRVKFWELWVFPGVYVLTIVPALLLGKPLGDILGVYLNQMGEYSRLTLNAPSAFQFVPYDADVTGSILPTLGVAASAVLVLALLGAGLWLGRRLDRRTAMAFAVVLAIGVPFFLPHMHERYFFLADVLTLCWACVNVRRIPVAVLACGSSLACYIVYLRLKYSWIITLGRFRFVMPLEALAMLAALVLGVIILAAEIRRCARKKGEEW